jgi:hypothetical protein
MMMIVTARPAVWLAVAPLLESARPGSRKNGVRHYLFLYRSG